MNFPVLRAAPAPGPDLLSELCGIASDLRGALERFRLDSRLADIAEKDMPDARQRLSHVLTLTDNAAHRTMDLVEQSCPAAERTAREAAALTAPWMRFRKRTISVEDYCELLERMDKFLASAHADSAAVRANLAEVLLAQGYQDLSGQIIRGVMKLVAEVERTVGELTRLSRAPGEASARTDSNGAGPA